MGCTITFFDTPNLFEFAATTNKITFVRALTVGLNFPINHPLTLIGVGIA